jgi:hypothetical protein
MHIIVPYSLSGFVLDLFMFLSCYLDCTSVGDVSLGHAEVGDRHAVSERHLSAAVDHEFTPADALDDCPGGNEQTSLFVWNVRKYGTSR